MFANSSNSSDHKWSSYPTFSTWNNYWQMQFSITVTRAFICRKKEKLLEFYIFRIENSNIFLIDAQFHGTVVNRTWYFIKWGSLEISSKVPLSAPVSSKVPSPAQLKIFILDSGNEGNIIFLMASHGEIPPLFLEKNKFIYWNILRTF